MTVQQELRPLALPAAFTPAWCAEAAAALDAASRAGPAALKAVLPQDVVCALLERCQQLLQAEPTLLEVAPPEGAQVVVVGDTHGQFHDVCRMLEVVGSPSPTNLLVFNGDFVDRGAWGLETLVLLTAWKLTLPAAVHLLRGNHESATCTLMYGFKGELVAKYGKRDWRPVYAACKRLFSSLPLAARIAEATLVLHGGLFRRQPQRSGGPGKNKRKRALPLLHGLEDVTLGTLDDLRKAGKGGMDPNGLGAARLASDVLWSDPVADPGFRTNDARGVGMVFGPDVTERFLTENGLRLVLRSHEGPDARDGRDDMQPMSGGYTLDHDTPAGKLMTVFSAPDYPQFMPEDTERYNNLAAVAVLTGPDWATPNMQQYAAAHPRPEAQPYYELWVPDSDEEWEPAASDASGMTDVQRPTASVASDAATFQEDTQAAAAAASGEIDSLQAGSAAVAAAAAAAAAAADEDVSADTGVALEGAGASAPALLKVHLPGAAAGGGGKQEHECSSPSRKRSRRQQAAAGQASGSGAAADKDAASADTAVAVELA
jgi:serine/threonine-protein phosphatase 5